MDRVKVQDFHFADRSCMIRPLPSTGHAGTLKQAQKIFLTRY